MSSGVTESIQALWGRFERIQIDIYYKSSPKRHYLDMHRVFRSDACPEGEIAWLPNETWPEGGVPPHDEVRSVPGTGTDIAPFIVQFLQTLLEKHSNLPGTRICDQGIFNMATTENLNASRDTVKIVVDGTLK